MKQSLFTVKENRPLTDTVYQMTLLGDTGAITAPGQFINIKLDGFFLRRPISVYDWDDTSVTIVYKVVGAGTKAMANYTAGDTLDILTGLGNGYDLSKAGERPLLVGGGVGVPPLYGAAKRLRAMGKEVYAVLGFNTQDEVFALDAFEKLGVHTAVTTTDGSMGTRGFVTAAMPKDCSYVYTCGPEPMLKAVYAATTVSGQYSFEERMGCGFGACMGCSCKTVTGYKRICKDGPVLEKEEILW